MWRAAMTSPWMMVRCVLREREYVIPDMNSAIVGRFRAPSLQPQSLYVYASQAPQPL